MERIASFCIDHTKLEKGMYLSREDFTDLYTYDIRMKRPNRGDYLSEGASHTFEHLFATYVRNTPLGDKVVYVGPMGCMTGCYFLTKGMSHQDALNLTQEAMAFVLNFEGDIPGASEPECGNCQLHDLPGAKAVASDMLQVLENWTVEDLKYKYYLE